MAQVGCRTLGAEPLCTGALAFSVAGIGLVELRDECDKALIVLFFAVFQCLFVADLFACARLQEVFARPGHGLVGMEVDRVFLLATFLVFACHRRG